MRERGKIVGDLLMLSKCRELISWSCIDTSTKNPASLALFPTTKRRRIRPRPKLVNGCFMGPGGVRIVIKRADSTPDPSLLPNLIFTPVSRHLLVSGDRWTIDKWMEESCSLPHCAYSIFLFGGLSLVTFLLSAPFCCRLLSAPFCSFLRSLHLAVRFCVYLPLLKGLLFSALFFAIIHAPSLHLFSFFC